MQGIFSWLGLPIFPRCPVRIWMVLAAALIAALAVVLIIMFKRKKKGRKIGHAADAVTQIPRRRPVLELANLQGIGSRSEQQDSFRISRLDRYEEDGLLAVLCDGMGGMAEGGLIASQTASELMDAFPWEDDENMPQWIRTHSEKVYRRFRGHGGTTLVAALLRGDELSFWCVGDSDLFLLREGKLIALNTRQEYKNELVLRALSGAVRLEDAFADPQAGALSKYIGKEDAACDYTRIPFRLKREDTLLLCSDGVSDTLTLKQIREALTLPPQECCARMEEEISAARRPQQDNYTAIIIKYNGKGEER